MAAKQPGLLLIIVIITSTQPHLLYLTALKPMCPYFCFPSFRLRFPSSLYPSESLRSCLLDRSKWLRQRERRNVWETEMLESQRDGEGGGGQSGAVVMSHLLQADRMAEESWHVPHTQEEGGGRGDSQMRMKEKRTYLLQMCK